MEDQFHCWYPLQIRFRDLDPLAHVNNTVYFTYFEEARSHYFKYLQPWLSQWPSEAHHQEQDEDGEPHNPRIQTGPVAHRYGLLVKEISCTYKLPLIREDHAEVGVRVIHVGRTSFIMEYQIRDTEDTTRIFASGRSVMVWTNYHIGRPAPVPPSLRYAFEQMEGKEFPKPEGQ